MSMEMKYTSNESPGVATSMSFEHVLHPNPDSELQPYGFRDIVEEFSNVPCEVVQGRVPEWIRGTYYKQAGGAFGKGIGSLDGLAHIAAFRFENGKVLFTNKFMHTQEYIDFKKKGERTWSGVAVAGTPQKSFVESVKSRVMKAIGMEKNEFNGITPKYTNFNPNVTIWMLDNGKTVAAQTEADGSICAFDPKSLNTLSTVKTMRPGIKKAMIISTAAHYFREGDKGGYHCAVEFDYSLRLGPPEFRMYYTVHYGDVAPFKCVFQKEVCRFKYTEQQKANADLAKRPSYMHSVAKTENYFVMILTSRKYDLVKLLAKDFSKGFFGLVPETEYPLEFMVLKQEADGNLSFVNTFKAEEAFMVWHVANSFESSDGKKIIIECGGSPLGKQRKDPNGLAIRIILDLENQSIKTIKISPEVQQARWFEFPTADPRLHLKPSKDSYWVTNPFDPNSTLVKLHFETDAYVQEWELFKKDKLIPAEPAYIPGPSEGEGLLLCLVIDQINEMSYLFLIEPNSGEIISQLKIPCAVNAGLHGAFIPNAGLEMLISKF